MYWKQRQTQTENSEMPSHSKWKGKKESNGFPIVFLHYIDSIESKSTHFQFETVLGSPFMTMGTESCISYAPTHKTKPKTTRNNFCAENLQRFAINETSIAVKEQLLVPNSEGVTEKNGDRVETLTMSKSM